MLAYNENRTHTDQRFAPNDFQVVRFRMGGAIGVNIGARGSQIRWTIYMYINFYTDRQHEPLAYTLSQPSHVCKEISRIL